MHRDPIGRVVGTERKPNTPHEFHFCAGADSPAGIGVLVKVEHAAPRPVTVYGVVVDATSHADPALHEAAGAGEAAEVRVYTAAVLRHEPAEPLQPVAAGPVFLADPAEVAVALRMDGYAERTGIPVGVYAAGGLDAPVWLDADFLLGPEAAHLNITGVSGLATKTSAVLFLLASIFEHLPRDRSVAALCFNVKGPDLLFLDQAGELSAGERAWYARLRVPAEPFRDVRYFAPYRPDGWNLATLRTHDDLAHNVEPLVWGLEQILEFAEVLLTREDIDAKADAFIEFIRERVVARPFSDGTTREHLVRTFAGLEAWFEDVLRTCEQKDWMSWRTHHVATIRKVRNRLLNLSTRARGLVSDDDTVSDLPWGEFRDRSVYVIDVANVEPEAQDLIFARVITEARERLERKGLGVDHLVVFADELNKYAPADGHDTYVRKMLLDVSERGRYLGLVLFGAQQFRSQVHRRVVGNAGTAVYGRMDPDELATPGYAVLPPAVKARLAALPKGELMVRHPHFTQPVFLRFPRPAVLTGRQGVDRFPPAEELPFDDAIARQLRRLDRGIAAGAVKDLVAGREPAEVLAALHRTRQARPADVLAYFRGCLRRRAPAAAVPADAGRWPAGGVAIVEDPYAQG
jgi:uncharacterized protein